MTADNDGRGASPVYALDERKLCDFLCSAAYYRIDQGCQKCGADDLVRMDPAEYRRLGRTKAYLCTSCGALYRTID